MAIKKCPECGKDVSTKADQCPHCGAAKKKPTQYGCGTLIVVVVVGFILYSVFVPDHSGTPRTDRAPAAPTYSVDTSEAAQNARQELLQEILNAGFFHRIEPTERTARVYVTQQFMALPIDDKELWINAVAAWQYTSTGSAHVRLIDYRTGKTVGSFLPPGGLSLR